MSPITFDCPNYSSCISFIGSYHLLKFWSKKPKATNNFYSIFKFTKYTRNSRLAERTYAFRLPVQALLSKTNSALHLEQVTSAPDAVQAAQFVIAPEQAMGF